MKRFGAILLAAAALTMSPAPVRGQQAESEAAPAGAGHNLEYPKWRTTVPGEYPAYNRRTNLVQRGKVVYDMYCVGCHGVNGDGDGPAALRLITRPRDFTSGIYKFRSTDSGSLPMEADLARTISRGLSRVSMPAFPLMPEPDRLAVIEYVKGFYPRWEREKDQRVLVPVPRAPRDLGDPPRVARGRFVYLEMQCGQCHGIDGKGTGATQTRYVDAWGHEQAAFNFTRGSLKGGNGPEEIYRTFHTGLRSIMPSFGGDTLAYATRETYDERRSSLTADDRDRLDAVAGDFPAGADAVSAMSGADRIDLATRNSWDLVAYILSLRSNDTTAGAVLGTPGAE